MDAHNSNNIKTLDILESCEPIGFGCGTIYSKEIPTSNQLAAKGIVNVWALAIPTLQMHRKSWRIATPHRQRTNIPIRKSGNPPNFQLMGFDQLRVKLRLALHSAIEIYSPGVSTVVH